MLLDPISVNEETKLLQSTLALGSLDLIDLNAENAAVPPPIKR